MSSNRVSIQTVHVRVPYWAWTGTLEVITDQDLSPLLHAVLVAVWSGRATTAAVQDALGIEEPVLVLGAAAELLRRGLLTASPAGLGLTDAGDEARRSGRARQHAEVTVTLLVDPDGHLHPVGRVQLTSWTRRDVKHGPRPHVTAPALQDHLRAAPGAADPDMVIVRLLDARCEPKMGRHPATVDVDPGTRTATVTILGPDGAPSAALQSQVARFNWTALLTLVPQPDGHVALTDIPGPDVLVGHDITRAARRLIASAESLVDIEGDAALRYLPECRQALSARPGLILTLRHAGTDAAATALEDTFGARVTVERAACHGALLRADGQHLHERDAWLPVHGSLGLTLRAATTG